MKVILNESYMNLGEAGDLVDVKPGYARNFLIPQKIAVTATAANVRKFQDKVKELEKKKESERSNSKKILSVIEKLTLTVKKKVADDGKLFGSVTTKDLEEAFKANGATVDRRQIVLGQQIKMVGDYSILVKLVGGMKTNVPLKVISDAPKREGAFAVEEQAAATAPEAAAETSAKKKSSKKAAAKTEETSEESN